MITEFNTLPKKTYYVQTAESCTVLDAAGEPLAEINAPGGYFPGIGSADAATGTVTFSPAVKRVIGPFDGAPAAGGGCGGSSSSGERVAAVSGAVLLMRHATWFNNTEQETITVQPAAWQNRVLTCYLKTEVPVSLSGVSWLYGEPAMMEGYSFVIALQQVDASTVLANLAYTIKQ